MDDVERLLVQILLLVVSLLLGIATCAYSEANGTKLLQIIENEQEKYKALSAVFHKKRFRQAELVRVMFVTVVSFCAFMFATYFSDMFKNIAFIASMSEQNYVLASSIRYLLVFIVVSMIMVCFAFCIPTRISKNRSEQIVISSFAVIRVVQTPFVPLYAFCNQVGKILTKPAGFTANEEDDSVTEEEIRLMVEAGEERGVIEEEELQMINNIFDFDDTNVGELMTHRTDIVGVDINDNINDVIYFAINEGFSRMPVFENDLDNIIGILNVKDFLALVGCKSIDDFTIKDFIRETIFVPQAQKCVDLFKEFKIKKAHIAVVVDDYGGTAGIISMEDLLEAIVGNIQDEYDNESEEIQKIDENTYILDGLISVEDFEELFDIEVIDEDEHDTINGLITNTLGKIPKNDEHLTLEISGVLLTVLAVEDRRILKVKAHKVTEEVKSSDE